MSGKGEIYSEMYADNYIRPRVTPILLVVLLLILGFLAFLANITIFEPLLLRSLGFCVLSISVIFFAFELLHRLWAVRTRRSKDGTKVTNFYLGWGREVERTEFADGRPSIYSTSGGGTCIDPRELVKSPQFRRIADDLKVAHGMTNR